MDSTGKINELQNSEELTNKYGYLGFTFYDCDCGGLFYQRGRYLDFDISVNYSANFFLPDDYRVHFSEYLPFDGPQRSYYCIIELKKQLDEKRKRKQQKEKGSVKVLVRGGGPFLASRKR